MTRPPLSVPVPDSTRGARLAQIASQYTPVNWHDAWKQQPEEIEWLIEPFLEAGTINALYGKAGAGKSLLTLEAALTLVRQGLTVVYLDEENRIRDQVERLQAFGVTDPSELVPRLQLYSFAGLPPLDTEAGGIHLLALAATGGADLVIIDTTSRTVRGKENDADTFNALFDCSLKPLKARGIAVLRLDHQGKNDDRGQRGSSGKEGAEDTIWRIVAETATTLRLVREKNRSNHAAGDNVVELRRRSGPLRHEWTWGPVRDDSPASKIAGQLNAWNVPLTAGRDAVRKILAEHGIKASNVLVSEAIRLRKNCPGQVADSPDSSRQPDLSAAGPPRRGDSGQDRRPVPAAATGAVNGTPLPGTAHAVKATA